MKVEKALITVAGPNHRELPLQTLLDRNRKTKTVLEILIEEISTAGIKEIGVVIQPKDIEYFELAFGSLLKEVEFIPQTNPSGYGHAILAAESFLNNESFLHLTGDHFYISKNGKTIAGQIIEMAKKFNCPVSAVQQTREHNIINFGTVSALRLSGYKNLYQIDEVKEKPTPTYAEQHLMISGLRAGYYLCFYGMHVFTPLVLEYLKKEAKESSNKMLGLSESLNYLAQHSKYLAMEMDNISYDIGHDYGLLKAQLALSLSGKDRDYILTELMQLFIEREKFNDGGF